MDTTRRFRVGDAITPKPVDAALFRSLITCRQLEGLRRTLRAVQSERPDGADEVLHFGLLGVIGAAKEAADAFRDCVSHGAFHCFDSPAAPLSDLRNNVNFLRSACDKNDGNSIYARLLFPIRNDSAFHFNRARVAHVLRDIAAHGYQIAETDAATHLHGVPFVRSVLARLGWLSVTPVEGLNAVLEEIDRARNALIAVGQDMYLVQVRLATED